MISQAMMINSKLFRIPPNHFVILGEDDEVLYNANLVKDILKNTQFSGDIKEIIRRHPHAMEIIPETFYAGGRGSAARFNYNILFDKIGQDIKEKENLNKDFEDSIPF